MGHIVLYCQPGARNTRLAGEHNGMPKVQLKAQPVDGAANAALIAFVAERMHCPRSAVQIVQGTSARIKRIEVSTSSDQALRQAFQGNLR